MADINTYSCSGRLTGDPELRYTGSEKAVASFTLAINGIKEDDTVFLKCTAWERKAEIVTEYLSKGSRVMVTGRLKENKWQTSEGENRKTIELNIVDLVLPPKADGQGGQQSGGGQQQRPQGQPQSRSQQPQRSQQQGRPAQGQRPQSQQRQASGQQRAQNHGWGADTDDNGWGDELSSDDIKF